MHGPLFGSSLTPVPTECVNECFGMRKEEGGGLTVKMGMSGGGGRDGGGGVGGGGVEGVVAIRNDKLLNCALQVVLGMEDG